MSVSGKTACIPHLSIVPVDSAYHDHAADADDGGGRLDPPATSGVFRLKPNCVNDNVERAMGDWTGRGQYQNVQVSDAAHIVSLRDIVLPLMSLVQQDVTRLFVVVDSTPHRLE